MEVFKPVRVERVYVQHLNARPESVFPLLCPVREKEWVKGWDPAAVYSESGYAEKDCVFLTGEKGKEAVWVITAYDREKFLIEMVKVTPGTTVGKIAIALESTGENGTKALVRYMYTALSAEGEAFVRAYSEEFYREFMSYWESALNEYLSAAQGA
ncbi:MAG: hypothetical protein ABFD98_09605 [Syntrophobacteraceae bacterium]|nr:hypothetical protein [Desulfobacteraceae bacterium]